MTLLVFFFAGMIVGVALVAIGRASKDADAWMDGFAAGCEHRAAEPLHLARITASDDDLRRDVLGRRPPKGAA